MNSKLRMNAGWVALALFGLVCGCSPSDEIARQPSDSGLPISTQADADSKNAIEQPPASRDASPANGQKDNPVGNENSNSGSPISAVDFPKPENAGKPMYLSETKTVMFHQPGTVEDQAKFYTGELGKLGWKKLPSSVIDDGTGFLDFKKGNLAITVTINPLRDGRITTIAKGSGISVPESLEQDDDENGDGDG